MTNSNSPVYKRFALAFSGFVYIVGAPFVVNEGLPFIALWTVVGFGLVRQMILAIAPAGYRFPSLWRKTNGALQHSVDLPGAVAPLPAAKAA